MGAKKLIRNPATEGQLTISVRKRGAEFTQYKVSPDQEPEVAKVLIDALSIKPGSSSVPRNLQNHREFLEETGILIEQREIPERVLPNLKVQTDLLLWIQGEIRARAKEFCRSNALVMDSEVRLQNGIARPADASGVPPEGDFPRAKRIIWVRQPETRIWEAYETSPDMMKKLEAIQKGTLKARDLPEKLQELLVHANILGTPEKWADLGKARNRMIAECSESIRTRGFAVVRDLFSPLFIALMRKYFREAEEAGNFRVDHKQVKEKRFVLYNESVCRFAHRQAAALFRQVTNEVIIPSYTYLSAYCEGALLERHIDRPQCRWNGSLLVDNRPDVSLADTWPIFLEIDGKPEEVRLNPGDVVIYRGTEIPHWRPKLERDLRQTLVLMHFVPYDFTGSLE
jgi:hypothetical protein